MIAVTAARGAAVVRDCVHLGVVDYLVKPFAPERLRQALGLFAHRMQALRDGELGAGRGRPPVRERPQAPPARCRAISRPRRSPQVRDDAHAPASRSAPPRSPIAPGVARVTARRYLEYLAAAGEVTVLAASPTGPGRPAKAYALSSARA